MHTGCTTKPGVWFLAVLTCGEEVAWATASPSMPPTGCPSVAWQAQPLQGRSVALHGSSRAAADRKRALTCNKLRPAPKQGPAQPRLTQPSQSVTHLVQLLLQRVVVVDNAHAAHGGHRHSHARLHGASHRGRAQIGSRQQSAASQPQKASTAVQARHQPQPTTAKDCHHLVHSAAPTPVKSQHPPQSSYSTHLGDCVHGGGHERRAQADVARHIGGQIHLQHPQTDQQVSSLALIHASQMAAAECSH